MAPDPRFFEYKGPLSLSKIASLTSAEITEGSSPDNLIEGIAPLSEAGSGDITFFENRRYRNDLLNTRASACFLNQNFYRDLPPGTIGLGSINPYKAFAIAASELFSEKGAQPFTDPESPMVHKDAVIGEGCIIEPGAVVHSGAEIGAQSRIESGAVIGVNVVIGKGCRIGSNVTLQFALIGDNVRIHPGSQIGQDGFGFAIDPGNGHVKVPQLGRVIIENNVEIGSNTTIDRGSIKDTVVGAGTWIDNLVQIAHNVKIGKGCVIVAQVGISGSTVLEDYVVIGGQAGLAGHLHIGCGARIAAQSGIMRDVPAGSEYMGSPGFPVKKYMRQVAFLDRMVNKKNSGSSDV